MGLSPEETVRDLTDEEVTKLRGYIDDNLEVEADLRRERSQRLNGSRRSASTAGSNVAAVFRSTDSGRDRRADPQGPEEDGRPRQKAKPMALSRPSRAHPPSRQEEHRDRPGAHEDVVNNTIVASHRQGGERHRLGERRFRRLQGLAQVDALRRPGHRRLVPKKGMRPPPEGRGLRRGPGSGRETAIRSLQAAGLEVLGVKDVSPQAHDGVRPKKRRRV